MSLSPTPDMDLGSPMDTVDTVDTMDTSMDEAVCPRNSIPSLSSPTFPDLTHPALLTSSPIPPDIPLINQSIPKTVTRPFLNYAGPEEIVLEEIPPGQLLPVAPLTGSSPVLSVSSQNFSMPSPKIADAHAGTPVTRPLTLRLDQPPTQAKGQNRMKRNHGQMVHSKSLGEIRSNLSGMGKNLMK